MSDWTAPTDDTPSEPTDDTPSERFADWPTKGGDDTQPWDLKGLGIPITDEHGQPKLEGDDRDTVSPVVPRAGLPLLTYGSQGDDVRDVAVRLGDLGYPNSVSRGENPFAVYDESVATAIDAFRRDYNVAEDPSQFVREPREQAASHAGPWTLEALCRASDRRRDEAA